MRFGKPSLAIDDQIKLLEQRGMSVPDLPKARHYLQHVSYYRLRAYWFPFETAAPQNGQHAFVAGTSFDDVLALYVFDRQFRLLVIDAIERIEVSLRGAWAHHLAMAYGPHGYLDPAIYFRADHFKAGLLKLEEEVLRSKDTFILHYLRKYTSPVLPPIWMSAEVISLGALSKWFGNLKLRADRNAISRIYGLDEKVLMSAAHHLSYIRNICAHHGRLWNRQMVVKMIVPNAPHILNSAMNAAAAMQIYNSLVFIAYMLEILAPGTGWRRNVIDLLATCPFANESAMGFPQGWRQLPAWSAV